MSIDINALIELNLNRLQNGEDIRQLELKQIDNSTLSNQISKDLFHKMSSEGLIYTDKFNKLYLSSKGMDIMSSGGWLQFLKSEEEKRNLADRKNEEKSKLEILNLKLQNENLVYAASIREKEEEIRKLTKTNLKYQIFYVVVGALIGAIGTFLAS